jgi:hypothetical protein
MNSPYGCGVDMEEGFDLWKERKYEQFNDALLPDICHYHINKPIND